MPIFHESWEAEPSKQAAKSYQGENCSSERSKKETDETAECSGQPSFHPNPASDGSKTGLNRTELIERIKRRNSPSWTLPQGTGRYAHERSASTRRPTRSPTPQMSPSSEPRSESEGSEGLEKDNNIAGLEIERPRSALHSGDFRQEKDNSGHGHSTTAALATSPPAPWQSGFGAFTHAKFADRRSVEESSRYGSPPSRARHLSQASFSSANFVLMPPTSPLVHQSNNSDLDSSKQPRQKSRSPDRNNRRHTFSPQSLQTYRSEAFRAYAHEHPPPATTKREGSFPYQAHQPRKSITSMSSLQPQSNPQTPLMRARRTSICAETTPLHHAPMVGSYEESILRGRMSTTPSRPLDFVAQIGVLGKGSCKPNLRCPPHVTVPFPAVFYSYNGVNGKIAENQPSPYVGLIDIENSLQRPVVEDESRRRRRYANSDSDQEEQEASRTSFQGKTLAEMQNERRKREKKQRRSASKSPPGGCYRIPQQGQLQIVIKNPNKTAVKLFLVPYDLSDMEPGQKTFIRQRSYSAGPIIDMPSSIRKNFGTDRPEAALSNSDDPRDRPTLRYLIHLHICCPAKGRYYLYKSIRVVFANRVLDGKEKLRNEVQLPEPRYSVYKPSRDSNVGLQQPAPTSPAPLLFTEKAFQRGPSVPHRMDEVDGLPTNSAQQRQSEWDRFARASGYPMPPLQPIPFSLSKLEPVTSKPESRDQMELDSPFVSRPTSSSGSKSSEPERKASFPWEDAASGRRESYDKLSKGDAGFGGFANGVKGAGLLARRLRGLDFQSQAQSQSQEGDYDVQSFG